jgi:hypothetical protein
MIKEIREKYNTLFTTDKYQKFLNDFDLLYNHKVEFRIAESPVFIPKQLKNDLIEAGEKIMDDLLNPGYLKQSTRAIPNDLFVANETPHPHFIAIDFAICKDENGNYLPQLIELQAFASLFFWQDLLPRIYQKTFYVPNGFTHLFNGLTTETYRDEMRKILLGNNNAENVVLLEIEPEKQKTWIDFWETQSHTGITPVCISKVIKVGKRLFYEKEGKRIPINRIYNRVIFDELLQRNDLKRDFNLTDDVDVEWAGHPNWFFRISKFSLPFLNNKYVPPSFFLHELKSYPDDLQNYVLKPLFSFAGSGVIIDVTKEALDKITDRDNYILQSKVEYVSAMKSPTGPVKVEIRLLYIWHENALRPRLVNNLTRLSKGAMIGVSHNKNKDWVGGSSSFFEI